MWVSALADKRIQFSKYSLFQVVAIKRIKLNPEDDEGIPSTALREVAVLKDRLRDSRFALSKRS